ncbi:alternative sulfate transporter [Viridothelium virens]|uniref:Alternative sulfate transporter n=1 Tax=Viridothelium virens TaxID=1048519 RepID=A0A6A6HIP7_VIRVR|nr:alternative sulfate transporter [Viridothelium virens]
MNVSTHRHEEHLGKEKGPALRVFKTGSKESSVPQPSGSDEGADWTVEEEERLVRRVDMIVMPLLMLTFFALQLDRGNMGNALTDFFLKDVGITQDQFNVGQQLLWVGIVVLEIPSNFVLYRVGPSVWISGQIIAWGLIATFQAFQKGLGAFLSTRLLLGLCESGFIPAGLYTITRWYKRNETSKRFAWFFIGNISSQALSGIIAYGILHMRGVCGLAGWQWLFLIEGVFTIVVGFIFTTFFPRGPANPTCYARIHYFNEHESRILARRVLIDDPTKESTGKKISMSEIRQTLFNWTLYPHILFTILGLAPSSTMWSYAPTLVNSFGYGRLRSNALVSIGQWIQLLLYIPWGIAADRLNRRGPLVSLGMLLWWVFALTCRVLIYSRNGNKRFAILTLAISVSSIWHPVNGSWMALNARSAGERSITLAVFIMSANCSGIIGSQLFQQSDGPLYRTGWTVIIAVVSVALFFTIWANVQYVLLNRGVRRKGNLEMLYRY